ncbi:MAG: hypothetical protein M3O36_15035 [Myxococcota bacterium]|nr:hypothetical protein [Myxococcota bacterium]
MRFELRALVACLAIAATACTSLLGLTDVPDSSVGDGQDGQVSVPGDAGATDGTGDAAATDRAMDAAASDGGPLAHEVGSVEASPPDASSDSTVVQLDGATVVDAAPTLSCSVANGGCDRNATCSSAGSVVNCTCNPGYSGTGTVCAPGNSCDVAHGGCDPNATCVSTDAGKNSCTCNAGYTGNGTTCTGVGSCATKNGGCAATAKCTSTATGPTCTCNTGYTGNGTVCAAVDSCATANGGCDTHATCTSSGPGTNTCMCKNGYSGSGFTCMAVDSCATNNGGCTAEQVCKSTGPGTNTCPCAPGFTPCGGACVDEMTNNTPNATNCGGCGPAFTCTGGTTCQGGSCACPQGFIGCTASCPSPAVSCIKPTAIAVGGAHACALLSTGEVECWGNNSSGQLGVAPDNGVAIPTRVPNVSGATAIQASGNSSCALIGNSWKCWGDSSFGQLGALGNVLPPATVFTGATEFSLGDYATCANVGGSVKCLGDATYGEIGTTMGPDCGGGPNSCSLSPLTLSSPLLNSVRSLSAGLSPCALTSGGSVVCWGSGATGQIGPGAASTCSQSAFPTMVPCSPVPVLVPGVSNAIRVSTGDIFACALIHGGTVQCWGDNSYGQLGQVENAACLTSTSPCSTSPLVVTGLTNATAIATGNLFACALLQDGTVDCWGFDSGNASVTGSCPGNASLTCAQTPVPVTGVGNATAIAGGGQTGCALLQSGAVQCWGEGKYGQLGNGMFGGPGTAVNVQW